MKLKFKSQGYQIQAVKSIVDCFEGQVKSEGVVHPNELGPRNQNRLFHDTVSNSNLTLSENVLLKNIKKVQSRQNLKLSKSISDFQEVNTNNEWVATSSKYVSTVLKASQIHLDVEMETGTGKTYCYIRTIFELYKRFGWLKFIVVVPSIAIREGVYKSFQSTAEHFFEIYGKKINYFIYNSKHLYHLELYSSSADINVMVINIQAFNSRKKNNLRIYEELDEFQSRKPIDVIASTKPILILDEPQKMEGDATIKALQKFKPLLVLRYSATHRKIHNKVYRLDAIDAYNQKLVKKILITVNNKRHL